mgnify:FL=1
MDALFVFGAGVVVGGFLVWAVLWIQRGFKSSRDLEAGVAKTRKEINDKAKKAREDKRKARAAATRSLLFSILLGVGVIFLLWLALMVVLPALL